MQNYALLWQAFENTNHVGKIVNKYSLKHFIILSILFAWGGDTRTLVKNRDTVVFTCKYSFENLSWREMLVGFAFNFGGPQSRFFHCKQVEQSNKHFLTSMKNNVAISNITSRFLFIYRLQEHLVTCKRKSFSFHERYNQWAIHITSGNKILEGGIYLSMVRFRLLMIFVWWPQDKNLRESSQQEFMWGFHLIFDLFGLMVLILVLYAKLSGRCACWTFKINEFSENWGILWNKWWCHVQDLFWQKYRYLSNKSPKMRYHISNAEILSANSQVFAPSSSKISNFGLSKNCAKIGQKSEKETSRFRQIADMNEIGFCSQKNCWPTVS